MLRYLGLYTAAVVLVFSTVHRSAVAAVDYAMQMPGAAESMLLDVAAAGSRLIAVGERGHILVSDDRGASWVQVEVPTSAMLTRVFFVDHLLGWAVGHDGNIVHTSDGGSTWVVQRDGVAHQAQINEQNAGRARARLAELSAQQPDGDDQKSERAAAIDDAQWSLENSLEVLESPVYAPPLMDVWFATPEQGWAAGAYGTLLRTRNGGRDWQDWSYKVDNADELHLNGVVGNSNGALFLASEWGTVFVSSNEGNSWRPVETGYDGSFFGVVVNPETGSVFAHGLLGTVYRSQNNGEVWQTLDSAVSASLFGAHAADGVVVFVGQGGTATLTRNDGETFVPMIQPQRDGLFGVVALEDGHFVASGEGGSKRLQGQGGRGQDHE